MKRPTSSMFLSASSLVPKHRTTRSLDRGFAWVPVLACCAACSSDDAAENATPGAGGGSTASTTVTSSSSTTEAIETTATASTTTGAGATTSTTGIAPSSVGGAATAGSETSAANTTSVAGAGGTATTTETSTTGSGGTGGGNPNRPPQAVCARWTADRQDMGEGTWSGSVDSCDPGDISPEARANALRLVNLYRWLAELPDVETSPDRNALAQACALMMEANGTLSHEPPPSWECYTEDGAEGAGSSNISTGSSVSSVDGYMVDPGNETTIGHRRWILSNSLGPIGLGSTGNGASCMQTLYGDGDAGKEWVAWPPPGAFPFEAYAIQWANLDETGWTIQSDFLDLGEATVSVTSNGTPLPVTVTELLPNYGSQSAIRFNPDGWEAEAGQTYSIVVSGLGSEIAYDVQMVECE